MAKALTKEEVLGRFKDTHGLKYDYSKVNYIDAKTKVTIICPEHGEFNTSPSKHYGRGHGCPKCAGRSGEKLTGASFIKRAIKVHGTLYDYSYVPTRPKSKTKVKITCPIHGTFEQRVDQHLGGAGCPECIHGSNEERSLLFIEEANKTHSNKYDYSKAVFVNVDTKVAIICPIHGTFEQTPYKHLLGQSCPVCATRGKGFRPEGKAILYYLRVEIDDLVLYKIGITGKTITERYSAKDLASITVLSTTEFQVGKDAHKEEQRILKVHELSLYNGPKVLESGNTELFTKDVLNKDKKNNKKASK